MGREFLELFEQWADSYDSTVIGHDIEYKNVFMHYERILEEVASRSTGHVVEFGVGTGNLTKRLSEKGLKVTGIEPSPSMRKLAKEKLGPQAVILDGDFLDFPSTLQAQTFVSSYAFHHLTDNEKAEAVAAYGKVLPQGGKIVFADTMFKSEVEYQKTISEAIQKGFLNLAKDLQTEYYTTIPILKEILENNGFVVSFSQCNEFVWLMEGVKQ